MPLYEYKCKHCEHRFAELNSVENRENAPCQKCGKAATHSITAVHFDPKMGLDPHFVTFGDKWAKSHSRDARRGN